MMDTRQIFKIHNIHMGVSYDLDHIIHKYLERRVNSTNSFVHDRKYIISINRHDRYDMSIQLLTGITRRIWKVA